MHVKIQRRLQAEVDGMDIVTDLLAESLAFGIWYERYPWAIDGVLYLMLFVGIAKVSLGRRFPGRGGTAVVASVGSALAIAAATTAYQTGFTLAQLGPIAWLIFLSVLGILLFDLARSVGVPIVPAAATAVLIMTATASSLSRSLDDWLLARGLASFVRLAALASLLTLIFWIVGRTQLHRPPRRSPAETEEQGRRLIESRDSARDADAAKEVERSLAALIERAVRQVRKSGVDSHTGRLLEELGRRERLVKQLYDRILRRLAQRRWKESPERQRLQEGVSEVLQRAKQNIGSFERQLEIAVAGQAEQNASLLLGALERLLNLERQGERLAQELRNLLRQLVRTREGRRTSKR